MRRVCDFSHTRTTLRRVDLPLVGRDRPFLTSASGPRPTSLGHGEVSFPGKSGHGADYLSFLSLAHSIRNRALIWIGSRSLLCRGHVCLRRHREDRMTYYAALDVGLRAVALCIIDKTGEVKLERSLPSEVNDIVDCLRGIGEEIACVGLEAGSLTQWLTYGLRAAGFKPVVLEARHVQAALAAMRNNTERNDARGIAQILRTGWYRPVHVKSIESHYTRTLLAARKALLRKCID